MTQQSTILLANFMSEQLEHDMKRNILVNEGELTQMEADLQAEEWETVCYYIFLSAILYLFVVYMYKRIVE